MTQEDVLVLDVSNTTYPDLIQRFVDGASRRAMVVYPLVTKEAVLTGLFHARLSLGLKKTLKITRKGNDVFLVKSPESKKKGFASKFALIIFLALVLSSSYVGSVWAATTPPTTLPKTVIIANTVERIRLPTFELYAPAKIVLNFAYTKNVTIAVTLLGTSIYKTETSPVQVVFETSNFDIYTVNIKAVYERTVNQTLTMGVFEGTRPAKEIEFDINADGFQVQMKISTIEAPHFPTVQEISDALWDRWRNELASYEAKTDLVVNQMTQTMTIVGALGVIGFVVSLACIMALIHSNRTVSELEQWGIRHAEEHRKAQKQFKEDNKEG